MKYQYFISAFGMYINYFLLGMVNIILASNMSSLTIQLDTDATGVSYLIAAIGIGRLITYSIAGALSDRIGRKPLIIFSAIAMVVFLVGIPFAPNYGIAIVLALFAGISNSAMDAGTYPALTEMFPKSASSASVMIKGFVSLGATFLPYIILILSDNNLFYGISFLIPAVIYIVNMFFLFFAIPKTQTEAARKDDHPQVSQFLTEPKFWKEGLALIIIGFTSTALLTVSQIWLPSYGQEVAGMSASNSVELLSYYSIGSLISVLFLSVLLKKILKPVTVILLYPIITLIAVTVILCYHTPLVLSITCFFLGFSTAGILQLAISMMTQLFWKRKGAVTGFVSTASSIASVVLPVATGLIAKNGNMEHIFIFDSVVASIGIVAAAFLYYRYQKLTKPQLRNQHVR